MKFSRRLGVGKPVKYLFVLAPLVLATGAASASDPSSERRFELDLSHKDVVLRDIAINEDSGLVKRGMHLNIEISWRQRPEGFRPEWNKLLDLKLVTYSAAARTVTLRVHKKW